MYPNAPYIKRNGPINAWDDPNFRAAVEATGKKQMILAGITTDVCDAVFSEAPRLIVFFLYRFALPSLHCRFAKRDILYSLMLGLPELQQNSLQTMPRLECVMQAFMSFPNIPLLRTCCEPGPILNTMRKQLHGTFRTSFFIYPCWNEVSCARL